MIVIVDSREQKPFSFQRWNVDIQQGALSTGDYSLAGFEDRVAIERKELDDLISCFMGDNRTRFEKELARGGSYELFAVVTEGSLEDIGKGRFKSNMKPHAALQTLSTFFVRYSVPFMCCGSRQAAEYMTYSLLAKYLYELEKRFKQAQTNNQVEV